MKRLHAFLAEYAMAHEDGRVYVVGGLLDTVALPQFPGVLPQLSVVLKVVFAAEEADTHHVITVTGSDPSGNPLMPTARVGLSPRRAAAPEATEVPFACVFNLRDVELASAGEYEFVVAIDDDGPRETIGLSATMIGVTRMVTAANTSQPVLRSQSLQLPGVPTVNTVEDAARPLLTRGYRAFREGRLPEAEVAFREAIERLPTHAQLANNLGFVLLVTGRPEEALGWFDKAAALGYNELEVLVANQGCSHYLLGSYEEALSCFIKCITSQTLRSPMVLAAIDDRVCLPVNLNVAGDYVGLVALNAGWAAQKQSKAYDTYAGVASIGMLSLLEGGVDRETFSACLAHLLRGDS